MTRGDGSTLFLKNRSHWSISLEGRGGEENNNTYKILKALIIIWYLTMEGSEIIWRMLLLLWEVHG